MRLVGYYFSRIIGLDRQTFECENVIIFLPISLNTVGSVSETVLFSTTYWPAHEILVLIKLANSKDSDKPVHTPNLVRAFAARI